MAVLPYGRSGVSRPPFLVIVLGVAFVLLMVALLIGSFVEPEFPPYPPTVPTPVAVGDSLVGPKTYTVDASAPDRWRRFDFSRNAVVDSGAWDIAFRRTHVMAAPGVAILDLGPVLFDSITHVPDGGYVVAQEAGDTTHPAVGKWYDYNYLTHLLRSKGHVYALRTADGRYAKFAITHYYCAGVGTACVTFRYVFQGNGSRLVGRQQKVPG